MIVLPKPRQILPATAVNPRHLVLYGIPKLGKTTIVAEFTRNHNAIILDIDPLEGTKYIEGTKIWCPTLAILQETLAAINAANRPYEYGIIDTITDLEELAIGAAANMYASSSMGKKEFNPATDSVLDLAHGAGYNWLRIAYGQLINIISAAFNGKLIMMGHVRDKELVDKDGNVIIQIGVSSKAIDLTGKNRAIAACRADAMGYLYRKTGSDGVNRIHVSFVPVLSEKAMAGNRSKHLIGYNDIFDWDKIYIDEGAKLNATTM